MFSLAPLIFRNVLRNRRRSALTLASTAISLALLAFVVALYQGFFLAGPQTPSEASRLITRHKVSLAQSLPSSYGDKISRVPGVAACSTLSWFGGVYIERKNFFAQFAVDPDTIFEVHKDWIIPTDQLAAFKKSRTACLAGQKLVDKFKWKIGDRINITGEIYPVNLEMTLVGIYQHPPQGECVLFQREYLRELFSKSSASRDTVGSYVLLAKDPEEVPRIAKAVDAMFGDSSYPTLTESEQEFGRSFLAFLGNIKLFLAAICAAVTFTILLVSANTVAMAVRERTREMAILRTLGYSPGEILQLVLGEAVVISIIGGLIGISGAFLMTKLASGGGFPIPFEWPTAAVTLVAAAVIGLLSSLVPAILASRKNVVESLRFAG